MYAIPFLFSILFLLSVSPASSFLRHLTRARMSRRSVSTFLTYHLSYTFLKVRAHISHIPSGALRVWGHCVALSAGGKELKSLPDVVKLSASVHFLLNA